MLVAGIMSGTSLDGIDVALVETDGRRVKTLAFASAPYPALIRYLMLALADPNRGAASAGAISEMNFALGEAFAERVIKTCKLARIPLRNIELIGSHGQTIYHDSGRNSFQIGEAAVIAERTGIPVVSNFRARDIAAGGKGAPLVPFVDALLFPAGSVALNIGGIANVTALGKDGSVVAFDTG
ncbi:MAG: anhydro-N-acetylmuramic acid kinase, partial [Bryobacteraceae bacterium]